MVWCVMERVDGPCRPENSFIRFEEFLEKYYREEMTEADRAGLFPSSAAGYVTAVSRKFYCEVGTIVDHRAIKPLAPMSFHPRCCCGRITRRSGPGLNCSLASSPSTND